MSATSTAVIVHSGMLAPHQRGSRRGAADPFASARSSRGPPLHRGRRRRSPPVPSPRWASLRPWKVPVSSTRRKPDPIPASRVAVTSPCTRRISTPASPTRSGPAAAPSRRCRCRSPPSRVAQAARPTPRCRFRGRAPGHTVARTRPPRAPRAPSACWRRADAQRGPPRDGSRPRRRALFIEPAPL